MIMIFVSYEEAKKIINLYQIKNMSEYNKLRKELKNKIALPFHPYKCYKKDWIDWYEFLDKVKSIYPLYEEAKKICKENSIKNVLIYYKFRKQLNLPADPSRCYKNKNWISWYEFLRC